MEFEKALLQSIIKLKIIVNILKSRKAFNESLFPLFSILQVSKFLPNASPTFLLC